MPVSSRTRKRKFFVDNSDEQRVLFEILSENRNVVMKALARKFDEAFYDAHHLDIPSVSTVYKAVIRRKWTRKVVTGVHIRKDPELQMSIWTTLLSHVRAEDLVDVDGMAISKDDFYNRFGFAPRGERCEQMQILIHNRTFAAHAAYCTRGFMHKVVIETTQSAAVTAENVRTCICH